MSRMAPPNGIPRVMDVPNGIPNGTVAPGFGILFATAVTLVLVPTVVLIVNDIRQYLGDLTGSVNDTSTAQVNSEHSQEF